MVYETTVRRDLADCLHAELLSQEEGGWIVFFSPSTVLPVLDLLRPLPSFPTLHLGAIGPTTATALTEAGCVPAAVAKKPSPEALVQEILDVEETKNT